MNTLTTRPADLPIQQPKEFHFVQHCMNCDNLPNAAASSNVSLWQQRLFPLLLFALLSLASSTLAHGRDLPARWTLSPQRITAAPGDTIILSIRVQIEKGWHTYGIEKYLNADGVGPQRTEFSLSSPHLKILERRIGISPAPHMEYDSAFEINVHKLKGTVRFAIPVLVGRLPHGSHRDTLRVYHQLCTNQNCLPPEEIALPFELAVRAAAGTESPRDSAALNNSASKTTTEPPAIESNATAPRASSRTSAEDSFLGLLALAIVLGVGSWLMPCVYPMIPITVSYFSKRAEKEHTRPILDSAVYSVGIMSTFIVFGAVAALFFGATAGRDIATNPWLNLAMALLFLVIAGNLFGMYELRLPSRWINALNRESARVHGYRSSFLMGMVFSLTSFTCTVPFVDIIGKMAAGGEWFRPLIAMTVYAGVFAVPFFLLAMFPGALHRLPRSGVWMNHLKVSFAFIEIAFAVSYLARVDSILGIGLLSREFVLAIWAACTLLIAAYVLGLFRTKLDTPLEYVGGLRATIAASFLALTLYLVQGMFDGSVGPLEAFVYVESARTRSTAPRSETVTVTAPVVGQWTDDLDAALRAAKTHNIPVFVDFTGVSCTNCRWMEKNMFTKPSVRRYMERMILVRAFTDRRNNQRDEYYKRLQQERFGSTLLPFYVIIAPNGSVVATATYTPSEEDFTAFLQKAPLPSSVAAQLE